MLHFLYYQYLGLVDSIRRWYFTSDAVTRTIDWRITSWVSKTSPWHCFGGYESTRVLWCDGKMYCNVICQIVPRKCMYWSDAFMSSVLTWIVKLIVIGMNCFEFCCYSFVLSYMWLLCPWVKPRGAWYRITFPDLSIRTKILVISTNIWPPLR